MRAFDFDRINCPQACAWGYLLLPADAGLAYRREWPGSRRKAIAWTVCEKLLAANTRKAIERREWANLDCVLFTICGQPL
jgi:hypothetical protein